MVKVDRFTAKKKYQYWALLEVPEKSAKRSRPSFVAAINGLTLCSMG
jgi:hypothetical protein